MELEGLLQLMMMIPKALQDEDLAATMDRHITFITSSIIFIGAFTLGFLGIHTIVTAFSFIASSIIFIVYFTLSFIASSMIFTIAFTLGFLGHAIVTAFSFLASSIIFIVTFTLGFLDSHCTLFSCIIFNLYRCFHSG